MLLVLLSAHTALAVVVGQQTGRVTYEQLNDEIVRLEIALAQKRSQRQHYRVEGREDFPALRRSLAEHGGVHGNGGGGGGHTKPPPSPPAPPPHHGGHSTPTPTPTNPTAAPHGGHGGATPAPTPTPGGQQHHHGLQGHAVAGGGPHPSGGKGGHTNDLWRTEQCKPVACGADAVPSGSTHALHGAHTTVGAQMAQGCQQYDIYNFMTNATEQLSLTCQGCVPHTCGHGEHDCVPVYCEVDGELHGGHTSDPCEAGHHADDGLAWWPFLLLCLVVTILVTFLLDKLGNGACFGKSFNPPFTVVMFFFGYLAAHQCSDLGSGGAGTDGHEADAHAAGVMSSSILAWKAAHPHVILFVLLPPLLFEDASSMDWYVFRKVLLSSVILAGPGVALSMGFTALTTMLLFGFAEECVIETDAATGEQIVAGSRENTIIDGQRVCDPEVNAGWQTQQGPGGGLLCIECVEGSYTSAQLPVSAHLLLGGMLAATDPVAVCAVLNDLGCPDKLNFMIAGESLLNDGTAVVAFLVMQSVAGGCDTNVGKVLVSLVRLAGGGVLWGLFMAAIAYHCLKYIRNPNIEITTLVFCTLATFWLAENVLGVSGVLGTVVYGTQTARTSVLAMDEHSHHANHAFWSEVGYVATAIIFILAGVKSEVKISGLIDTFSEDYIDDASEVCSLTDELECIKHTVCRWEVGANASSAGQCIVHAANGQDEEFHVRNQLVLNFILWVVMTFIRAGVVAIFAPVLGRIGYGLTWKEAAVMVWGGLRGAVSLSLALLVDGNHLIGDRARELIFLQTTGIVTLTLIINGTTAGVVYKALKVYPPNPFRSALATQGLRNIQQEMDKSISALKQHWFHANADFEVLRKLFPNFKEAVMCDGDLVGIEMDSMDDSWHQTREWRLNPIPFLPSEAKRGAAQGIKILDFCQPAGRLNNFDKSEEVPNPVDPSPPHSGNEDADEDDPDHHGDADAHGHAHGHGHGHHSHAQQLAHIRQWLQTQDQNIEPSFAMYAHSCCVTRHTRRCLVPHLSAVVELHATGVRV
jgi:NhaP-type Na+/H+ or K+/H+ antiporter